MNERRATAEAVFERDGYACVRCDDPSRPDDPDPEDPPVFAVDGADPAGAPEALLATVCASCRDVLDGECDAAGGGNDANRTADGDGAADDSAGPDGPAAPAEIFRRVRDVTSAQGAAVAAAASFASAATARVDASDDAAGAAYLDARRRARVTHAYVDRRLRPVADLDASALDDEAARALEEVSELAVRLQNELGDVVDLAETAVAASGRCHACLRATAESDRCEACGADVRSAAPSGAAATDDESLGELYATVSDRLQDASGTTGELTERAKRLATLLAERS